MFNLGHTYRRYSILNLCSFVNNLSKKKANAIALNSSMECGRLQLELRDSLGRGGIIEDMTTTTMDNYTGCFLGAEFNISKVSKVRILYSGLRHLSYS